MTPTLAPENGVDVITFYHPDFWGVGSYDDIMEIRKKDALQIWTRILDALNESGVTQIELTFPPADWTSAIEAFGSASAFGKELSSRGLTLKSGFILAVDWGTGKDAERAIEQAVPYADFLGEAGGDVLVAGPPMRRSRDSVPPLFIDLEFASRLADVLHRVGDAVLRRHVKLALHTEAHSVFCTRRDIDLMMMLTDPEYVFLCPDTAHIILAGSEPVRAVEGHLERIALAHWKDAVGPMPSGMPIEDETIHEEHRKYMCTMGTGAVNWPSWAELYGRCRASEVRMLELDAVADPVKEMKEAVKFLDERR